MEIVAIELNTALRSQVPLLSADTSLSSMDNTGLDGDRTYRHTTNYQYSVYTQLYTAQITLDINNKLAAVIDQKAVVVSPQLVLERLEIQFLQYQLRASLLD